jgi:hypothetical protein
MTITLPHPRCKDFVITILDNPIPDFPIAKLTIVNMRIAFQLSQDTKKILKEIKGRSFYKAIEFISRIKNKYERDKVLQVLYSSVTYTENNNQANILELWIDDLYLCKDQSDNNNECINQYQKNDDSNLNIIVRLGFNYKNPLIKRESSW